MDDDVGTCSLHRFDDAITVEGIDDSGNSPHRLQFVDFRYRSRGPGDCVSGLYQQRNQSFSDCTCCSCHEYLHNFPFLYSHICVVRLPRRSPLDVFYQEAVHDTLGPKFNALSGGRAFKSFRPSESTNVHTSEIQANAARFSASATATADKLLHPCPTSLPSSTSRGLFAIYGRVMRSITHRDQLSGRRHSTRLRAPVKRDQVRQNGRVALSKGIFRG